MDTAVTPVTINANLRGTNLPAWLAEGRLTDPTFQARTIASGTAIVRIPGGSWSNSYDWLACERGFGIDNNSTCYWPWAARPTDFINFLRATDRKGMYTVNVNGTAKEAAALVAFFNGSVTDDREIGVDVRGRDWGLVSTWAQLRSDNGNPEPFNIRFWEVGNEVYGGTLESGSDCLPWGWENVWTCDGTEYVTGIGSGSARHEGYLEFRDAMHFVDDTIMVGAVGVPFQSEYNNWGNEVISAAGSQMDFYSIHQYAYYAPPANVTDALAQPHGIWEAIKADVDESFALYANGRNVPIAITEHNLFSDQEQDNGNWMEQGVNMLYMADTLGQMAQNGFDMANQWNLSNGEASNGTDYGLLDANTFDRNPQYYAFVLWSQFGTELLPVNSPLPAETDLSVYASRIDTNNYAVLAINKTMHPISMQVELVGVDTISGGTVDVARVPSLNATVTTFNNVSNPADDLSDAPPTPLQSPANPLAHTFEPYSITLLRLQTDSTTPPPPPPPPPSQAGPQLAHGVVSGVNNQEWTRVELPYTYDSMVVVTTANYDQSLPALATRIRSAEGSSFEISVERLDKSTAPVTDIDVHYFVIEEGVYTEAEHGVKMEAVKFTSTVTDNARSWVGEARSYANSYANPVVLGQVMTVNDPSFSVFWAHNGTRARPPSATSLYVGKHVGEDPNTARLDEVIGYVVIEAGSGTLDETPYTAALGPDSVQSVADRPPYVYSYSGISRAATAVLTQSGMDGGNGSWALLYGTDPLATPGEIALSVDEDQRRDSERRHTDEQVAYIVFE